MINSVNTNLYFSSAYGSSSFDYSSAVTEANKNANELLNSINGSKSSAATVKTMQKDTAKFLNDYSSSMRNLDQSAEKLRNGNLNKLLYDKNGEITDDTLKKTVDTVKDMITRYNETLKLLNDNADRGSGIKKQLSKMVGVDPAPESSMKMVGISVNKDGTLSLDDEKLTSALKTQDPNQRKLLTDILGGSRGIAEKIHTNTLYGSNMSSWQLVGNDVSKIKAVQNDNPYSELYNSIKGNAYALNNMAYSGLLLNMLV